MQELLSALCQFHQAVGHVPKNRATERYAYADLAAVLDAIREPLVAHGLTVTQTFEDMRLVTTLWHSSGQHIQSSLTLPPLEGTRGLNQAQALGSAISYCRRYSLLALLNLAAEDDDGAAAGRATPPGTATPDAGAVPF